MRNVDTWRPSKFVYRGLRLDTSWDPAQVAIRSRLAVGSMAPIYDAVIHQHARGRLLDLGCGKVPLFGAYRNLIKSSVCLDWPAGLHGNEHVDVAADLTAPLPLLSESFDTVVATDVLEHLPDPSRFWSEVSRVLKPGGHVILGVPFLYWLHEVPHDYMRHTEFSLCTHCSRARLAVVSLQGYGGPASVVLDIVGKNIWHHTAARVFQASAIRFCRSRFGRALDSRNSRLFPMGYCLVATKQSA